MFLRFIFCVLDDGKVSLVIGLVVRLNATFGISGHNIFSFWSFSMRYQCRLCICPMWVVLLLYGMLNIFGVLLLVGFWLSKS